MSTFNSPSDQSPFTRVRSGDFNTLDAAVATAFALLPDETLLKQGKVTYAVDTANAANAYLISLAVSPAEYADGLLISFRPLVTNTGASTINVNSLGVKSIRTIDGAALTPGAIVLGAPCLLQYSTVTGYFHLMSSGLYQQASGSYQTLTGVESVSNKTFDSSCSQTVTGITYGSNAAASAVVAKHAAGLVTLNALVSWSGAGSLTSFMTLPAGSRPSVAASTAGRLFDTSGGPAYSSVLVTVGTDGTVSATTINLEGAAHSITPASGDAITFSIAFSV